MSDGAVWGDRLGSISRIGPAHVACNDGLDTLSQMAARILDATRGPLRVVGHSMGGRVALELVAQAPERVERLALLSTGAHGVRETERAGRMAFIDLARASGMRGVAEAWMPDMVGADCPEPIRAAITAMLMRATPDGFAAQQNALLNRPDHSALLTRIACPVLVMTGAQDLWASPAQHAEMSAAISTARLSIVDGAGHMLPMEAPDRLAEVLLPFLDAC